MAADHLGMVGTAVAGACDDENPLEECHVRIRQFREELGLPSTIDDTGAIERLARAMVRHVPSSGDGQRRTAGDGSCGRGRR